MQFPVSAMLFRESSESNWSRFGHCERCVLGLGVVDGGVRGLRHGVGLGVVRQHFVHICYVDGCFVHHFFFGLMHLVKSTGWDSVVIFSWRLFSKFTVHRSLKLGCILRHYINRCKSVVMHLIFSMQRIPCLITVKVERSLLLLIHEPLINKWLLHDRVVFVWYYLQLAILVVPHNVVVVVLELDGVSKRSRSPLGNAELAEVFFDEWPYLLLATRWLVLL